MERQELEALVGDKVTSVVSEKQNELMEGLSSMLTAKFQLLEKNFTEKQSSLSDSQVMRLRSSTLGKYQFKRKSCEEQFNFNSALEEKFSDIDVGLSVLTEESLERAKNTVSEGKSLIHQRQKLLKLADSSELGWKVVNEYQSNPLASDSEDERKIYKAEVRAERKAHKEQMKKLRSRKSFRARPYSAVPMISSQPQTSSKPAVATTTKPGLCWHCGNSGHWRFECEVLKKAQTNNKISSFIFVENGVKNQDDKHSKCIDNVTHVSTEGIFDSSLFSISCASKEKVDMKACNKDIVSQLSPVGSLKSRYGKWADITSNGFILSVIEDGYKIPFKEMPESVDLKNNKTARDSMEFVKSEVNKLLGNGCVVEVKDKPIVINH